MGKKKIGSIVVVSFLISFVLYGIFINMKFKESFRMTTGRVTDITGTWKNGKNRAIMYEYEINSKKENGTTYYEDCGELTTDKLKLMLLGKPFPIAYSTKKIGIRSSTIIITEEKAKMFNYKIPDSLLVYDSILTCK